MLDFVTVFNPSFSTNERDAEKQLLLFHSFQKGHSLSLNDKLAELGIIQATWRFSESFVDSKGVGESVLELGDKLLCTILVEEDFFVTLAIELAECEVPATYFLAHLRHCYDFFVLQFGSWCNFENPNKLTDCLNEVLVPFWSEMNLMPNHIWYTGFLSYWPQCYKAADLDNEKDLNPEALPWDTRLKQQVLLDDASFLGLQDILVYHLPKPATHKGYKSYGLVRNFTPNFDSLPKISNWIEYLDTIYTRLSSHVIAGNVQYKEILEEDAAETSNENEEQPVSNSLMNQSKKIYHNFTLPITFAYDAVQEVSNMTGVSSSMSLLTDFMPKIPSWNPWASSNDNKPKVARSEFLISPLSASFLPESYKVKVLELSYNGVVQSYNCLFWFYNEILVVLVFKKDFAKIWDHEYLHDIHFKLTNCISELYSSHLTSKPDKPPDSFCYATISKETHQIRSSFPLYKIQKILASASPLELVVNGLDEFLTSGANRKTSVATLNPTPGPIQDDDIVSKPSWGLSLMGGIFRKEQLEDKAVVQFDTFLDNISDEKLRCLHLDISKFVNTLSTSRRAEDLKEEKLIKLNNGVVCFIREDSDKIVILVENWFDKRGSKSKRVPSEKKSLVQYMRTDVTDWWNRVIRN
ncbi:LANO_0G10616g1_1 [Lachancea nothofagi CBS 11611]|uniref:LANO_0G10616g1_1 n=1 Tax=Lachancea nothofagi CBS 11611 TaxID=1266666 RepID=A0A1G4KJ47_9SACH|nr:LANO_0G10616g1_1 [Lachancea nothofagi CBS 11611]